jgi:hypothetical protein
MVASDPKTKTISTLELTEETVAASKVTECSGPFIRHRKDSTTGSREGSEDPSDIQETEDQSTGRSTSSQCKKPSEITRHRKRTPDTLPRIIREDKREEGESNATDGDTAIGAANCTAERGLASPYGLELLFVSFHFLFQLTTSGAGSLS